MVEKTRSVNNAEHLVAVIGSWGVGKSSCLNALLSNDQASRFKTGETQSFVTLKCHELGENVRLMDTPGLNSVDLPLQVWLSQY